MKGIKRVSILILCIVFIVITAFAMTACFGKGSKYQIIFKVDDEVYATVNYKEGDLSITMPENPTKEGYVFMRWEYTAKNGRVVEFTAESVRQNIEEKQEVYAVFYSASNFFETNDAGDVIMGLQPYAVSEENIVIPEQVVEGVDVTKIATKAFKGAGFKSVSIPKTMKHIEDSAFEDCTSLTTVSISDEVEDMYIHANVFKGCSSITSLVVPNGVKSIQRGSLNGTGIVDLSVPFIGTFEPTTGGTAEKTYCLSYLFDETSCGNVKNLTITKQKKYKDYSLTNSSIETITITADTTEMVRIFGTGSVTTLKKADFSKSKITSFGGAYMFWGFTALEEVLLPDTFTTVSFGAFQESSIKSINLPDSVTEIESMAFYDTDITSINLKNVTTIGNAAFAKCEDLETVVADNVTSFDSGVFHSDPKIESISLPKATQLTENMFKDCTALKSINVLAVTDIATNAFLDCSALEEIIIPNTIKSIQSKAFDGCIDLKKFEIKEGSSVDYIGYGALCNCVSLEDVIIPYAPNVEGGSLPIFSKYFAGTQPSGATYEVAGYFVPQSLTSVKVIDSNMIPDEAFRNMYYLEDVQLCDSIYTVASAALSNTAITDFVMPTGITTFNTIIGRFSAATQVSLHVDSLAHYMSIQQTGSLVNASSTLRIYIGNTELTNVDLTNYQISTINSYKFSYCPNIASITLPEGLEEIGASAFYGTGLTSIVLPNTVTKIGASAFYRTGLTSITLPSGLTNIGSGAFSYTSLQTVQIPQSLTEVDGFSYISTLESVTFESGAIANKIMSSAFKGSGLTSFEVPSTIKTISADAFKDCNALTSFTFNSGVTDILISSNVFSGTSFTTIVFPSTTTFAENALKGSYIKNVTLPMDQKKWDFIGLDQTGVKVIVNSTSICNEGFLKAKNIVALDISSVEEIGLYAFTSTKFTDTYYTGIEGLNKLMINSIEDYLSIDAQNTAIFNFSYTKQSVVHTTSLYIGDTKVEGVVDLTTTTLTTMPIGAFMGNTDITQVILPSTFTSIPNYAFTGCTLLEEVDTDSNLARIGVYAFYSCPNLDTISLNLTKVSEIGSYAFYGCPKITTISVPQTIEIINDRAFCKCSALISFTFNGTPTIGRIGTYAFNQTKLTSFELPASVTVISDNAFSVITTLTSFTLASGSQLTTIGSSAFGDCENLASISTMPSTINSISNAVFAGTAITSMDLSQTGIITVAANMFNGCANLVTVTLPNTIRNIYQGAFQDCVSLEHVYCTPTGYVSLYSRAFQNDALLEDVGSMVFDMIGTYAFDGCAVLEEVHLASDASYFTDIETYAFRNCSNLRYINIPASIVNIKVGAFYNAFPTPLAQETDGIEFEFPTDVTEIVFKYKYGSSLIYEEFKIKSSDNNRKHAYDIRARMDPTLYKSGIVRK